MYISDSITRISCQLPPRRSCRAIDAPTSELPLALGTNRIFISGRSQMGSIGQWIKDGLDLQKLPKETKRGKRRRRRKRRKRRKEEEEEEEGREEEATQCKNQIQEALRSIEREHQRDALLCIWSNVFPVLRIVIVIRQKRPHMATLVAFRASCSSKRSITGG